MRKYPQAKQYVTFAGLLGLLVIGGVPNPASARYASYFFFYSPRRRKSADMVNAWSSPPRPAPPRFLENVVRQALLTFLIKKSFIFTISGASVEKLPFGDNAWCSSGVITKRSRTCWPEHRKIRTSWPEHEKACKCVPSFRKQRDIYFHPLYP